MASLRKKRTRRLSANPYERRQKLASTVVVLKQTIQTRGTHLTRRSDARDMSRSSVKTASNDVVARTHRGGAFVGPNTYVKRHYFKTDNAYVPVEPVTRRGCHRQLPSHTLVY